MAKLGRPTLKALNAGGYIIGSRPPRREEREMNDEDCRNCPHGERCHAYVEQPMLPPGAGRRDGTSSDLEELEAWERRTGILAPMSARVKAYRQKAAAEEKAGAKAGSVGEEPMLPSSYGNWR